MALFGSALAVSGILQFYQVSSAREGEGNRGGIFLFNTILLKLGGFV